jgi:hypothetical protein
MVDASDPTGACARCADKTPPAASPPRVPAGLPYADLGIAGDGDDSYLAGHALLAEMTRSLNNRRKEAGEIFPLDEVEAVEKAGEEMWQEVRAAKGIPEPQKRKDQARTG